MTGTNLKLERFASWISHTSEMAPQFAKRRLISLRRGYLPGILFLPVVMQLCAVSAAAQVSIVILEKNRRRIALPTTDVTRIAGATRGAPQAITVVPMNLEVGDVLVGNSGVVAVRIRCNFAVADLSGKFRVRMLPSPPRDCNLYFEGSAGARISTTASGPTNVVSGAFTLGTRRTRYEIEIPDKKRGGLLGSLTSRAVLPIAKVYEGEARVNSPGFSGALKEGQKLVAEGLGGVIQKIAPEDYQRAAELHAQLDVSQAGKGETVELSEIFLKLADKPESEVRARADHLVQQARAGADFCALARAYSERPTAGPRECRMGSFSVSGLPPEIATAIKNMHPGGTSEPLRSTEGYQILHVDAREPGTLNDDQLKAAFLKLLGLHRDVLENPHDPSKLTALTTAQQQLSIPASDVPPPPASTNTKEMSLKPNEKGVHTITIDNDCKTAVTFRLTVNNTSFVRLVSPVDVILSPGNQGKWQLEYDATGLNPGTYSGEVEIICVDCANKQCLYLPQIIPLTLKVL